MSFPHNLLNIVPPLFFPTHHENTCHAHLYVISNLPLTSFILASSSCIDSVNFPSTPPHSLYPVNKSTPAAQHHPPSTLTSSPPPSLPYEIDSDKPLSLSHPPDYPAQVTSPLPASSTSISHLQPQSKPHHFPSSKGSGGLNELDRASDETAQQPPLPGPLSAIQPGTLWRRYSKGNN